jgi:hypothetical protein
MGQENMLDLQFKFGGKGQILSDVALRIHDGGYACFFVANQVGSMGEAIQIELLEDQEPPPSLQATITLWIRIRE